LRLGRRENAIATSPDGLRLYDGLRFEEAFEVIDQLVEQDDKTPE
jgi:hypothetical protein